MPDTGAPWNIPYVESTDLVSDWPSDSLALANAIDAGLDAANGLVDVKSALFTGTQTASVASSGNVAVTDLSITHEVADASNKLIIFGMVGVTSTGEQKGNTGVAVAEDGTLIGVATSVGTSRHAVSALTRMSTADQLASGSPTTMFVHTPGTGSKTYTLRVINARGATQNLYVNRSENDTDTAGRSRGVSSLIIMEVSV